MNLLNKKAAAAQSVYIPGIDVFGMRHEITQIRHAQAAWRHESDSLAASAAKDWATDTLVRARRRELREFMADAETRIQELTVKIESADDNQAAERKRLEPLIEAKLDALGEAAWRMQQELDALRPLLEAHNAAGGQGMYQGKLEQIAEGVVGAGEASGRFMATNSMTEGKRLAPLPRK